MKAVSYKKILSAILKTEKHAVGRIGLENIGFIQLTERLLVLSGAGKVLRERKWGRVLFIHYS